ncbi:hypothetical protein QTI51_29490 [Variovorax sp. J22G73]|jgi:hypothetical protein|uniref:hypothetical protein n=1 Tax=unclassified Variovorax TaxID=663243 RepID=UPI000D5CD366|nr:MULTISPECIES: hypothetical protein [unclassified Variovorax]MDM0008940.1 hypothetical protein [Variovorax sp. J22R203]MDM0101447.1 hypothetical protein [Variovorax sp. J22G73]
MSTEMLQQIAASRLPLVMSSSKDVDAVLKLRAAGLVLALVPSAADIAKMPGLRVVQVLAVTQKGFEELQRVRYPGERAALAREKGRGVPAFS